MILQGHISWSGLTKSYTDNPISIAKPPLGVAAKSLDKQKRKCYTCNIRKKKAKITMKRGIQKWKKKRLALTVQQSAVNV